MVVVLKEISDTLYAVQQVGVCGMKCCHLQLVSSCHSSALAQNVRAPAGRGFLQKGWACNVKPRGGALWLRYEWGQGL